MEELENLKVESESKIRNLERVTNSVFFNSESYSISPGCKEICESIYGAIRKHANMIDAAEPKLRKSLYKKMVRYLIDIGQHSEVGTLAGKVQCVVC